MRDNEITPTDFDILTTAWTPSSDQMTAYARREVELCIDTILRGAATSQSHTLYSQQTWNAAIEQLGGRLPVIPQSIIKSLEMMREAAAVAASARLKFGKNGFASASSQR